MIIDTMTNEYKTESEREGSEDVGSEGEAQASEAESDTYMGESVSEQTRTRT